LSKDEAVALQAAAAQKQQAGTKGDKKQAKAALAALEAQRTGHSLRLARQLEELTGLESRVTILGYLQRGGTPSAADRLLATRLGTACAALINEGVYGVMVAARGDGAKPVPLEDVVGKRRIVPLDHPWIESARHVGMCLGE
jgi:6-phosphofructokinase 1